MEINNFHQDDEKDRTKLSREEVIDEVHYAKNLNLTTSVFLRIKEHLFTRFSGARSNKQKIRFTGLLTRAAFVVCLIAACSDDPIGNESPQDEPPRITTQPQDVTTDEGGSATFSVTATSTTSLTYQWERDGAAITGANSTSYMMEPVATVDSAARFSVVVSNEIGTVESQEVRIVVRTAPSIVSQPKENIILSGIPAGFDVKATGADLEYQWLRNGKSIPEAMYSAYFVGVPLAGDDGSVYSVVVSNDLGSVTSNGTALQVLLDSELRPTSYANAKALNQVPSDLPGDAKVWTARAFGDFFGNGNRDFFVANSTYDLDSPPSEAQPGEFQFWRWTPSGYVQDNSLRTDETGCIHPRTAVAAELNGDARPDIFVTCHGYDRDPYPGEPSYVVLSQPGGTYSVQTLGDSNFYHGATAVDIDGDADIDIIVTSWNGVLAFVNDGSGGFSAQTDLIPIGGGGYYTIEAADVNGDGLVDLLAGGHDWENAPTVILLNDGSGSFASVDPINLPSVVNEGVILDFAILDADRDGVNEIYVARTSGGDGTFYESRTVQRVRWPGLESDILLNERPNAPAYFMFPVFEGGGYSLFLVSPDAPTPEDVYRLTLP